MTNTSTHPCAKCKAPIFWVQTKRGAWMPLDPEPHPEGNVRLQRELNRVTAIVLPKEARPPDEPLYRSHFASCAFAADFRKQR